MLKLRRDSKSMTNVTLWCGNEHEKKTCVHKLMQSTYLWVCVVILQMLEGRKLVLTTIGISATFPNSDSCHIFVYVYVCMFDTAWLHHPSQNPFFKRALFGLPSHSLIPPFILKPIYSCLISILVWSNVSCSRCSRFTYDQNRCLCATYPNPLHQDH